MTRRMFTHAVLFEIKPKFVKAYIDDCKMWSGEARKAAGFIRYRTLKRVNQKNQYASVYYWEDKRSHFKFMKKNHDDLVKKSKAKVKVLGYYNFSTIDEIRKKEKGQIMASVKELTRLCHKIAKAKGFWDGKRNLGEMLMLIVTELSEAMESYRVKDKENFDEEIADTFIRLFDLCGGLKIDIEKEINKKMLKNKKRPYKHGKIC